MDSLIPGYFLEDFVDMLCNQKLHQSWELLFHHSVVSAPAQVPPGRLGMWDMRGLLLSFVWVFAACYKV